MNCLKCEAELPAYIGKGRPPAYCSKACRRLAEYELRRLQRRLAELEVSAQRMRDPSSVFPAASRRKKLTFLMSEIEAAEGRLRALLVGANDD